MFLEFVLSFLDKFGEWALGRILEIFVESVEKGVGLGWERLGGKVGIDRDSIRC